MFGYNKWSYSPYRPYFFEVGDIYICRVVPYADKIHFEWLENGDEYSVYYRLRGNEDFTFAGKTTNLHFDIENLTEDKDYEFYVENTNGKSRVRLARTGKCVGNIVNYLHPADEAYSFSGRYLCSPSSSVALSSCMEFK